MSDTIPVESIASRIYFIRGVKVMIDRDLAELYGVETKRLKEQVRRNILRFPDDFMFDLTLMEERSIRSQIATLKEKGKHSKHLPMVFAEQGVAMLSSVLHSTRAIEVNIAIMRAFVKMRQMLATNKEFAKKLEKMENHQAEHDEQFRVIFEAIQAVAGRGGRTKAEDRVLTSVLSPKTSVLNFSIVPSKFT